MRKLLLLLALVPCFLHGFKADNLSPYVQQNLMFFQSDRITMGGVGGGFGLNAKLSENVFANAELSLLWGNGNAIPTSFSLGWHKSGTWQPAISGTVCTLWGDRTEMLSDNGERPVVPLVTGGIKLAPLRFCKNGSYVSALELGYGFGPYKGHYYSLSLLSASLW